MTGVRIGSLCTGYGGLDMAVQQVLGGDVVWHSDVDPGASALLAHHHPEVPNLGDLTAVDWAQVLADLGPVDVVTGGYPCQPFSLAGDRKGTDDARHIWPHIATALDALRPRIVVLENVAGHLSLGFADVLADLARLGFDAEWECVRASDVGAAHARRRLFVVAWPADPEGAGRQGPRVPGPTPERGQPAADTDDLGGNRDRARGARRDEPAAHRQLAADTARVRAGEPADEAVPVAAGGDARPVPGGGDRRTPADTDGDGRQIVERQQSGLGTRDDADGRGPIDNAIDWSAYAAAVARWARVFGRPAPRPADDRRRLNPAFVEWLMGLPAGHVTDVPGLARTAQLKLLGNGVVPQQAAHALRLLLDRAGNDLGWRWSA